MAYTPQTGDYYSDGRIYYRWTGDRWTNSGKSRPAGNQVSKEQAKGAQQSEKAEAENKGAQGTEPGTQSNSLRYPEGLEFGKETDYVMFTFHRYKSGGNLTNSVGNGSNKGIYSGADAEAQQYVAAKDLPEQIILNMPSEVQSEIGAEWGGKSFSFIGSRVTAAGAQLAANDFKGAASTLGNFIGESVKSGDAYQAMAAAAIVAGINKIPGVGGNLTMNDLIQGASSKILNPNVELMYEGPQLRALTMNLKLFARTSTEAQTLRKIGRAFRKAALPSSPLKDDKKATAGRFIATPAYVKIRFMRGGDDNPDVPKYMMCALTGASVNYAPDGQYVSFAGGYLPALQLGLTLQETKIIFSDDIDIEADGAVY